MATLAEKFSGDATNSRLNQSRILLTQGPQTSQVQGAPINIDAVLPGYPLLSSVTVNTYSGGHGILTSMFMGLPCMGVPWVTGRGTPRVGTSRKKLI